MIRTMLSPDIDQVMKLWLAGNIQAHLHKSEEYWKGLYPFVESCLPEADVYVYSEDEVIKGFIGVIDKQKIGGLFVDLSSQRRGIGRSLLTFAQQRAKQLTLAVYCYNYRAINFYFHHHFEIVHQQINEHDQQLEYSMRWSA